MTKVAFLQSTVADLRKGGVLAYGRTVGGIRTGVAATIAGGMMAHGPFMAPPCLCPAETSREKRFSRV